MLNDYLLEILYITSDAEEQYMLLEGVYHALGVRP